MFPNRHNFIAIIPARLHSTRLPRKLLLPLGDKTILQRTYEQALKVKQFSEVFIATDSEEIVKEAEKFTKNILITTTKPNSGTERIIETLDKLPLNDEDVIINLQGDEPFMSKVAINDLINVFKTTLAEIATIARPCKNEEEFNLPSNIKVVINSRNYALYFSRSPIPFPRNNIGTAYIHAGLYGYTVGALKRIAKMPESILEKREGLEQLKWLDYGEKIYVKTGEYEFFGIDTKEDYELAKKML